MIDDAVSDTKKQRSSEVQEVGVGRPDDGEELDDDRFSYRSFLSYRQTSEPFMLLLFFFFFFLEALRYMAARLISFCCRNRFQSLSSPLGALSSFPGRGIGVTHPDP